MSARIQLHLVTDTGAVTPISIDVKTIAYFHAREAPWVPDAKSDLLINTRLITVRETFTEIAKKLADALVPNDEPWRNQ